jgi:hypothetical protein
MEECGELLVTVITFGGSRIAGKFLTNCTVFKENHAPWN